jgi:hypothetical protein
MVAALGALIGKALAADRYVGLAQDTGDARLRRCCSDCRSVGWFGDFVSLHDIADVNELRHGWQSANPPWGIT